MTRHCRLRHHSHCLPRPILGRYGKASETTLHENANQANGKCYSLGTQPLLILRVAQLMEQR